MRCAAISDTQRTAVSTLIERAVSAEQRRVFSNNPGVCNRIASQPLGLCEASERCDASRGDRASVTAEEMVMHRKAPCRNDKSRHPLHLHSHSARRPAERRVGSTEIDRWIHGASWHRSMHGAAGREWNRLPTSGITST